MKRQTGEKDCINIKKVCKRRRLDGEHGPYLKISLQKLSLHGLRSGKLSIFVTYLIKSSWVSIFNVLLSIAWK